MRGFAYDGPLARALLTVAYLFAVSLSLVACAVPYVLFEQLVGWQPTHLALVTGVLSTLPFGPALFATLSAARDLLDVHGSPGAPFRRFRLAFASGVGSLWWYWALVGFLTLLMAYDVALAAEATVVVAAAGILAAVAIVLGVALSCAVLSGASGRPSALLVVAVRAAAARPHVALAWLLLVAVTYAVTLIPIIGPSLALFTPAAAACGILIVNRTFGFDEWMLRHATVDAARAS
jgi:hypothetical protein